MPDIIEHSHHRSACLLTTSTRCQSQISPNIFMPLVVSSHKISYYFLSRKNLAKIFIRICLNSVLLYIMIKKSLKIVAVLLSIFLLEACNHHPSSLGYKLAVKVDKTLDIDSVEFSLIEPDYGKIVTMSQARLLHGGFAVGGQLDGPRVARLKFSNGKTFYFILEQCKTEILFTPRHTIIWGGKLNHEFFDRLNLRNRLVEAIKKNHKKYLKLVADSAMTYKLEPKYFSRDSLLKDSLQRLIFHTINRNDEVGILFKDRFLNDLDSARLSQVQ